MEDDDKDTDLHQDFILANTFLEFVHIIMKDKHNERPINM